MFQKATRKKQKAKSEKSKTKAAAKSLREGVFMATLIPAIGTSAFNANGERRLAERQEQKLDADDLVWHNVPTARTLAERANTWS
jgi:hypothetical protein